MELGSRRRNRYQKVRRPGASPLDGELLLIYKGLILGIAAGLALAAAPTSGQAQEVLQTPTQALKEIFPEAAKTVAETRVLTPASVRSLSLQLGRWNIVSFYEFFQHKKQP